MSWESGEGDKQAGEARLLCITRRGGVKGRTGLRLGLGNFFFFLRRVRNGVQALNHGCQPPGNSFNPTADRHTGLWHPGNENCLQRLPQDGLFLQEPNSNLS